MLDFDRARGRIEAARRQGLIGRLRVPCAGARKAMNVGAVPRAWPGIARASRGSSTVVLFSLAMLAAVAVTTLVVVVIMIVMLGFLLLFHLDVAVARIALPAARVAIVGAVTLLPTVRRHT